MVNTATHIAAEKVWKILKNVPDPEVPALSVVDLGIIRSVQVINDETGDRVQLVITPTYTGCPAMDIISMNIRLALIANDYKHIDIQTVLSPAWTTDWMSEEGKQKLKDYGIAPPTPKQQVCNEKLFAEEAIPCPHCNSWHTHRVSEFGSTACKALYVCNDCKEPFDYFKCH
jgi:ring-1,2-phenylacetyl-CoA epoxidase subunit PaaD